MGSRTWTRGTVGRRGARLPPVLKGGARERGVVVVVRCRALPLKLPILPVGRVVPVIVGLPVDDVLDSLGTELGWHWQ